MPMDKFKMTFADYLSTVSVKVEEHERIVALQKTLDTKSSPAVLSKALRGSLQLVIMFASRIDSLIDTVNNMNEHLSLNALQMFASASEKIDIGDLSANDADSESAQEPEPVGSDAEQ
jgi:hypothetical protein